MFEDNLYCDFNSNAVDAVAGKDILLAIFDSTGAKLLAIDGQQTLSINQEKEVIEINSKTSGGWKNKVAGLKDWNIDVGGLWVADDESHKILGKAFANDENLCLKIINMKLKQPLFGGLAILSSYSFEAPYDDSMTYSAAFSGNGALTDLSGSTNAGQMPDTPAKPETDGGTK